MDIKAYLQAPIPRWVAMVAVVGTGITAGVGVHIGMQKAMQDEYDRRLEEEIANATTFYTHMATHKKIFDTPQEAAEALLNNDEDLREQYEEEVVRYITIDNDAPDDEDLTEVSHNVFTDATPTSEWDPEVEEAARTTDAPYILEHDEFYNSDFNTQTLTWYEVDEVLAAEDDSLVEDIDGIVGEQNLTRFGHGSRDNNVLYIRNPKIDMDFEVIRAQGSYAEIVHGIGLQHEDRPGIRKFRSYDE